MNSLRSSQHSTTALRVMLAFSFAAPATMVLATQCLPRIEDRAHAGDNTWYFALAAWVCLGAIVAGGGAMALAARAGAWRTVALSSVAIVLNLALGLFSLLVWGIRVTRT